MLPKPTPTKINTAHLMGPVYHYRNITDEEALALGVTELPPIHFNTQTKVHGATARRLRGGLLHVIIPHDSRLARDPGYNQFMDSLSGQQEPSDSVETMPVELDDTMRAVGSPGSWVYEVATGRVTWSEVTYQVYGLTTGAPLSLGGVFELIHPGDRPRMQKALEAACYEGREIDETYRVIPPTGERTVRCKGKPYDIDEHRAARRVAGVVCRMPSTPSRFGRIGRVLGGIIAALIVAIPDAPLSMSTLMADDDEQQHVIVQPEGSALG